MPMSPETRHLAGLFLPRDLEARDKLEGENVRFVHYTSAEVAMSMLREKEIWMRNALTMNDFSEIQHGKNCLLPAYRNPEIGGKLKVFLDQIFPGASDIVEQAFNFWFPRIEVDTYITCLSEHDPSEDELGRLSMWRAYAPVNGVAFVINNGPFIPENPVLGAYSSAVAYLSPAKFAAEFGEIVEGLIARADEVRALGQNTVVNAVFTMLRFSVLCTKHPGFKEEREWRIIHSTPIDKSKAISRSFAVVRGVPQEILKIPLRDDPENGLYRADPPSLVDRIIIGPTTQPFTMQKTFVELLKEAGVNNPEGRVVVSQIPLRT
jgi:Protein of unknown function (DUF2971)